MTEQLFQGLGLEDFIDLKLGQGLGCNEIVVHMQSEGVDPYAGDGQIARTIQIREALHINRLANSQ